MSETKIIKRQQRQFMLANLVTFIVIFSIFGVLIFSQIRASLFSKLDEELISTKNMIMDSKGLGMTLSQERQPEDLPPFNNPKGRRPGDANPLILSPRTLAVVRDKNGEITYYINVNQSYYESFIQEIGFDLKTLNTLKTVVITNRYTYRTLLFSMASPEGEPYYVQLLINAEGEQNLVDNFGQILVLSITVLVILALSASYILSRKTMRPIIKAWERQAEFVENASHELRTPLTIIQNKLEVLLKAPESKIVEKSDNIILALSETRRLTKLTGDLLTLARADSAQTQLTLQSLSLDDFIRSVCEPYIEFAQLQDKHLTLNLNCTASIQGDKGRIHQLLIILLDNALKYTQEKDGISVSTSCEDSKVTIEVRDTGLGISEEGLKRAFDRFYRDDKARSRENSGVGLGLSIAKWIVEQHRGHIQITQNFPKGIIVTVKLPK